MRLRAIRRSSWLIVLATALVGIAMASGEIGGPFERALEPLRFGAYTHHASGRTAIVEMDAASAAQLRRWPWPRRNYAAVVDRLHAAGAASIVFDVEFSAASEPADDAILAAALTRANGLVVLPTFSQVASDGEKRHLDALPLPGLRAHAALASVSIRPDLDGLVRTMPLATITAGTPRPSLSAYIAARQGVADADFPIDFAIDPATIPRLSFVAVRDGQFDPASVRGRDILVGATAVEMGDRYAATYAGVLPGVVIQALATETLRGGVPARGSALPVFALALLLCVPLIGARRSVTALAGYAAGGFAIVALVLVAQHGWALYYPLALPLAMLTLPLLLTQARLVAGRFRQERLTDTATALPNERAFRAAPADAAPLAVVQINNLDALACVLGTTELAQVIVRTAERLRLASADHQVYRVRSHHLALRLSAASPVADLVDALRAMVLEPIEVAGRKVDLIIAIGVADVATPDALTAAALAAETATRSGEFWCRAAADHEGLERSISLMGELDAAIDAGEVSVHYQAKLDLHSGQVTGAEALVRWHHPRRGFIPPDAFIPLAERSDRIAHLTLHVLSTVLRDLERWRAAGHDLRIAVNLSARLLAAPIFNAEVDRLLLSSAVPADALIFEVTESAAMSNPGAAIAALEAYRARGISVSIDDYGTGQSTLTYLRRLPLAELKIDRSFVQHAHTRPQDAVLVKSTIDLGHELGLKVVAEGVEDDACLEFLRKNNCDFAQGYFIAKPVSKQEFEKNSLNSKIQALEDRSSVRFSRVAN